MKIDARKTIRYVLSLLVAAGLVFFAFRGTDWGVFLKSLQGTGWWYVILSLVPAVAALIFRAERWRLMLLPLDPDMSRSDIWHGSNIGNFLNVVIPGVGEIYRTNCVSTRKSGFDKTFGTVLVERAWDVLAVIILLLIAIVGNRTVLLPFLREHVAEPFLQRFNFSFWWIVSAAVLLLLLTCWTIWHFKDRNSLFAKPVQWLRGIFAGIMSFAGMRGKFLFIVYTVGVWVMYIMMSWLIFLAVPGLGHLTFADAVFISAVGNIASVIPTPGNIGPYHYLVGLAVSTIYLGGTGMLAEGLLFATLSHGSHAILIILLGIESYIHHSFIRKR